jgi:hypothetical protein
VTRLRAAAVAAGLALLTACSTVPTSSPTVQITQAAPRPEGTVTIEPLSPEAGATPDEIVRGFIDAAASTVRGHPVAREHLTPDAAKAWADDTGITVLSTTDFSTFTTAAGRVRVQADVVGRVDQQGVFAVAVDNDTYRGDFSLEQVDGEWRIANPPDGLLLLQPDFERLYDELAAYFVDPTGQRLVPDPRYLITGEAQPTALVQRLLDGPSASLAPGVRNPMTGVGLRSAVSLDGSVATVDLTDVPTDPATALSEICAQLVWTLSQDRLGIRTVRVLVDGEPIDLDGVPVEQTVDDWQGFDPNAVSAEVVGHYIDGGVLRTVPNGDPVDGPAGQGDYDLVSAAVALDPRPDQTAFMVGVVGSSGDQRLLAGQYGGPLTTRLPGVTFSAPTVAATRTEIWVIRDGTQIVFLKSSGAPQQVDPTTLADLGRFEALELSPDGVRAAVVVDGTVYVATVVREEGEGGSRVSLRDPKDVAPELSQVIDVAWRDSGTLMVLAGDAAAPERTVPYTVGVDGWGLDSVPTGNLPTPRTSIAAAPSRPPLMGVNGQIYQWTGGGWEALVPSPQTRPGSQPFFPL